MNLFGGIEAGGTKFVCMVGTGPGDTRAEIRFPTTTPQETLGRAIAFFKEQASENSLSAIGVACFGPVDLNLASPTYGYITTTPKPHWAQANVVGALQEALQVPVGFDTDVNGAALAEYVWGNWPNPDPLLYFTIGTGVGMGAIINGKALHGLVHPESGHIRIPHDLAADPFPGACPYHGDCFEGLASGPAMRKRWNQPAEELPAGHPAWDLESTYIALALVNVICTFSPRQIVLGGGVMSQEEMFPSVRQKVLRLLNEYVQSPVILKSIESYIVPPALGNRSGVLGAIALAQQACSK